MASQKIIWTALPKGVEGSKLKLSVFVSPRLTPDAAGKLQPFPDFINWPKRVNALKFKLEFEIGASVVPADTITTSPAASEEMWTKVFNANTPVFGYQFKDLSTRFIHSYSARTIQNYVKNLYKDIAEKSPTTFPTLTHRKDDSGRPDLGILIGEIGPITGPRPRDQRGTLVGRPFEPRFDKQLRVLDPNSFASYGFTSKEQMAFYQANVFYERPKKSGVNDYKIAPTVSGAHALGVPKRLDPPKIDFHGMMAALGDYPEIMRRLGVVVDLEVVIPPGKSVTDLLAANAVRIVPPNSGDVAPWTLLHKKQNFMARPDSQGAIEDGMLRLENKNIFDLTQIDVDSAALKTVQFAGNMLGVAIMQTTGYKKNGVDKKVNYTMPDDAGLPALRTAGIGIIRDNRAKSVQDHLVAASKLNTDALANTKTYLHADDILRGYRIDVIDDVTGVPLSLCYRDGRYDWPGMAAFDILAEEGYVKGSSASSTVGGENDQDLYLHETLFQWDGWSLVASRPGKTIVPETYDSQRKALAKQKENPEYRPNTPHPEFKIAANFKATMGTLPRLRFGVTYKLRARTVDLSGWSISHKTPESGHASDQQKYLRFEPVSSPAIVLRRMVAEGESLEHMVIRSNVGVKASAYGSLPHVTSALAGKGYAYLPENERWVSPPKTSQLMAETHGMFDALIKTGPAGISKAFRISKKEEGSYLDTQYYDPEADAMKNMTGIALVTPSSAPPPHATLPVPKGDPLAQGQYVVHDTNMLELPYLPDVFARGVALKFLPGVTSGGSISGGPQKVAADGSVFVLKIPFEGTWPYLMPFRIMIHETDTAKEPVYEKIDGRGVLHVYLVKAQIARVHYSCYLGTDPSSGKPDISLMGIQGWSGNDLAGHAERGTSWMLSPFRVLEMVHAVQQPLVAPEFYKLQFQGRKAGDTYVRFSGNIKLDVPSTGRIDAYAEWFEPLDLLSRPKPNDDPAVDIVKGNVFDRKIPEGNSSMIPLDCPEQQDPATGSNDCRHEFNDTKHRWVDYHMVATTRFREYFHPEIWKDPKNITQTGPVYKDGGKKMNVLSTARPDAPKVLYVIPTYGWEPPKQIVGQIVQRRCGGGLRVYMDRPWYSSGEDEELAVVLINEGGMGLKTGIPDALKPYVTDWGMDPIWGSTLPDAKPRTSAFTRRTGTMHGLSLDELRGSDGKPYPVVSVAAHEVEYDEVRQLWFCDIDIDAGDSYTPFVRLALARFQRHSITDAHLSRVVLADFAQLAPDRVAAVLFDENAPTRVTVMVTGVYGINKLTKGGNFNPADKEALAALNASRAIAVTIEEQKSTALGELGWFPITGALAATDWLQPKEQFESKMLWSGTVSLPSPPIKLGGTIPYRLVIREYEFLPSDEGMEIAKYKYASLTVSSRVVYADTIELK